jgi:hypothetical protein
MTSLLNYLKVYYYPEKIRLGANSDGGYVIANLLDGYDCYISAGISNEESFSRDFIKYYNMNKDNSFGFDGTITNYPYQYTKDITFIKKNINSFFDSKNANLLYFMKTYKNIFLKMDIEGSEFNWLLNTNNEELLSFKQIVMELHGINNDSWGVTYQQKLECLKKLCNTHYLIHIHGNNHSTLTNSIPDVVEVTFVRKDCFNECPPLNNINLPIKNLDFPCHKTKPDINLSFYPFVNIK